MARFSTSNPARPGQGITRPSHYRVRVYRKVEIWVDVDAYSAAEAEAEAAKVPGVLSVFGQSAVRKDFVAAAPEQAIEEGDDDE